MKRFLLFSMVALFIRISLAQEGDFALKFNGTSQYLSFATTADQTIGDLTVEAWIKTTSNSSSSEIVGWSKDGNYVLEFREYGGHLQFVINKLVFGQSVVQSIAYINTGNWTHVAAVKSGTTVTLYVNGKFDNSGTVYVELSSPVLNVMNIGVLTGYGGGLAHPFTGTIDEVRIWRTARSQSDIYANMFKYLAGTEANLYAYYKMSDGSGTSLADDQSGGTLTGTLVNGPTWAASGCFSGSRNALSFNGTTSFVDISNGVVLGTSFTQEMWIYPTDITVTYRGILGYQQVVSTDRPPCVYQHGLNLHFGFSDGTTWYSDETTDAPLTLNSWNHIALTFDGTTYLVYVNGRLRYTSTVASGKTPFANPQKWIGKVENYFTGNIDEVRIWTVVRTASEIQENMMKNLIGNETGLAAYYRFDCSDGTTLYDLTSTARNGTSTNMDGTAWVSSTAFNTWIGSENSDWTTGANWSSGSVPVLTDNVGIYKWPAGNENTISGTPTVNNILFSSTASPILSSTFQVNGNLMLNKDLDLHGQIITLGSSGYLSEGSYRLYGTSGAITTTRELSNISALNVGGLGATLTTTANMGSTAITRGHTVQTSGGHNSILRYYDITPTTNTGLNATLAFNYNTNELNGISAANLTLFNSTDAGTNWTLMGGTVADNLVTLTGIDGFSRWTLGDAASPLPVELASFACSVNGENISLVWVTQTEKNSNKFDIQRKFITSEWTTLGSVKASVLSNSPKQYSYTDNTLQPGKCQYRLKMIDNDGSFEYSKVSEVEIAVPKEFILSQNYPNPFNPSTRIDYQVPVDAKIILEIYSITGQKVAELVNQYQQAGYYSINFSSSSAKLASGLYIYKIAATEKASGNNFSSIKKMILLK